MGFVAAACTALALGLAACGGEERQDENEPEGEFRVDVVDASFPIEQKLAKRSELSITVRNAGEETVPNIAVTVDGFDTKLENPDLADPSRPVFVINGQPKEIGDFAESKDLAPEGGDTAYVNTWALGPLEAGDEKTFTWSVTAVRAGRLQDQVQGRRRASTARPRPSTPRASRRSGTFIGTDRRRRRRTPAWPRTA